MTERITLDAADAAELIEMLEFCCDWIDHDHDFDPVRQLPRFNEIVARLGGADGAVAG